MDSSSTIAIVGIGGLVACGVSCMSGIGVWYSSDSTLGGLLGTAAPTSPPPGNGVSGSPAPGSVTSTSIPVGTNTYIVSLTCKNQKTGWTLLTVDGHGTKEVDLYCKNNSANIAKWKLKKVGNNYLIQSVSSLSSTPLYLGTRGVDAYDSTNKSGVKNYYLWRVSWNDPKNKSKGFSLFNLGESKYLCTSQGQCASTAWSPGLSGQSGHNGKLYFDANKAASQWIFKPDGSSTSTGANPTTCS